MRNAFVILLVSLFQISYGQISFTTLPLNKQLVGRDPNTNLGMVIIEGEVDSSTVSYDSIRVEVYREGLLFNTLTSALDQNSNPALFSFDIPIVAELANYSLDIYGVSGSTAALEHSIDSIVAGDVFIIQGQSNAEAISHSGSANANQSNFIRVYANGTSVASDLQTNNNWYIGNGDVASWANGNTGQWGLKLARMLVDSLNIPVAIFNGAHPSVDIAFFQAPVDYETSLASNFGRLHYRLTKTGLTDHVRAVLWSQGESDGASLANTSIIDYKNLFLSLASDWQLNYPNIENIYIFQTKNGCGGFLHNIKEAQRQLAVENQDISIISTAAMVSDGCHFPFINGYEMFGSRVFRPVLRDIYGLTTSDEIDSPMIIGASLINDTTLVVETDAIELSIDSIAEDFQLDSDGSATITNIETENNNIVFSLSEHPGSSALISYLAQNHTAQFPSRFITNTNDLELVCFYQYPVDCTVPVTMVETACNSYTWIDGNTYTVNNNTATHILPGIAGCDTLVSLNLTIHSLEPTVETNSPTLTSETPNAIYQWMYCDSVIIEGETDQSFTAIETGNYAVIVSQNGCVDTSACQTVNLVNIEPSQHQHFIVYPNPTTGSLTVDLGSQVGTVSVTLRDMVGKTISDQLFHSTEKVTVEIEGPQGVYVVELATDQGHSTPIKVIKE